MWGLPACPAACMKLPMSALLTTCSIHVGLNLTLRLSSTELLELSAEEFEREQSPLAGLHWQRSKVDRLGVSCRPMRARRGHWLASCLNCSPVRDPLSEMSQAASSFCRLETSRFWAWYCSSPTCEAGKVPRSVPAHSVPWTIFGGEAEL